MLRSVANLTRADGAEFMALAAKVPLKAETKQYSLEKAPRALQDLRQVRLEGAAVLIV